MAFRPTHWLAAAAAALALQAPAWAQPISAASQMPSEARVRRFAPYRSTTKKRSATIASIAPATSCFMRRKRIWR